MAKSADLKGTGRLPSGDEVMAALRAKARGGKPVEDGNLETPGDTAAMRRAAATQTLHERAFDIPATFDYD